MCHVGNKIADELYEGCRDWIHPQSHIVTDCWRAYPEVVRRLQACSTRQSITRRTSWILKPVHARTASKAFGPCSSSGYANATASPEAEKCSTSTWASSYGDKSTRTKIHSKYCSQLSGDARVLGRQRPEILTSSIIKLLSNPTSCPYEVPSETPCSCAFPAYRVLRLLVPTSASMGSTHVTGIVFPGQYQWKPLGTWWQIPCSFLFWRLPPWVPPTSQADSSWGTIGENLSDPGDTPQLSIADTLTLWVSAMSQAESSTDNVGMVYYRPKEYYTKMAFPFRSFLDLCYS